VPVKEQFRRVAGGALAAAGLCLGLASGGCEQPHAAETNLRLTPEEERQVVVLGAAEQSEVHAAVRSVAEGHEPVDPPAPAPPEDGGMRFSDVPLAASAAASEIEAVVVAASVTEDGDTLTFRLRTIENFPGELVVTRAPRPVMYTAVASIGRFPDDHAGRADTLVRALGFWMKVYGRKKR
jgi:hypothetical protein